MKRIFRNYTDYKTTALVLLGNELMEFQEPSTKNKAPSRVVRHVKEDFAEETVSTEPSVVDHVMNLRENLFRDVRKFMGIIGNYTQESEETTGKSAALEPPECGLKNSFKNVTDDAELIGNAIKNFQQLKKNTLDPTVFADAVRSLDNVIKNVFSKL